MDLKLRPYQRESINAIFNYYGKGKNGNVLVSLPTGSGKSIIQAVFINEVLQKTQQVKFLCLCHRKELVSQNEEELNKFFPGIRTGIYSAGLNRREVGHQVTFAGIQSVYKMAEQFQDVRIILIDEVHLVPKSGQGMYRKLINELMQYNPKIKIIGLTATPYRTNSGLLTQGKEAIFRCVVYEADIKSLVDDKYLSSLTSRTGAKQIDTSNVGTVAGEFNKQQLEAEADKEEITDAMIDDLEKYCQGRQSVLVFCSGVAHAEHVKFSLLMRGHSAESITGGTPSEERANIINKFKTKQIRCLVNCDVLTTGFNAPATDVVVLLRPTKSTGLYVQMLGRGMRIAEGKADCLVLDFGGNIDRHGPIDQVRPKEKRQTNGNGTAPEKCCPRCCAFIPAGIRICPECDFLFPAPKHGLDLEHSQSEVMSSQAMAAKTFEVYRVHYHKWKKIGKKPTLRVDYMCGLTTISEWICIEHDGFAGEKAYKWWERRDSPDVGFVPMSVDAALIQTEHLLTPTHIKARKTVEGYWRIDAYSFPEAKPTLAE